ncbi:MAG: MazG nucleotide pyrophosphohydrolase domain-containing protein [Planctomycetota bacterium]|jgi:NTP pyrophosphatase (non-canonical NTP hydrolase)
MEIAEFQKLIRDTYHPRDSGRGPERNFLWFAEEVGELAEAIRHGKKEQLENEFADVLAWLASLANLTGVDMERAIDKYRKGCPGCGAIPCTCPDA